MEQKTPRPVRGEARKRSQTTHPQHKDFFRGSQNYLSVPALAEFRERLVVARARLVERVMDDFSPDRAFPDTGWSRLLADLHTTIEAVDSMIEDST